jgi:phage terminase small subunit
MRRAVAAAMAASGPTTETASGTFKASPEFLVGDRVGRELLELLREFGLTPASRSAVAPIVTTVADQWAEFLGDHPIAGHTKLS